jgi:hypothetical protein
LKIFGKKLYKIKKNCRICNSKKLIKAYDLGFNPIGDDYTRSNNNAELIPLEIQSCLNCGFKQLSTVVDENKVYGDYLYTTSTSKGLTKHFEKSCNFLIKKKHIKKNDFVLDIGSNDGSNLEIYKKKNFKVLGVEPAIDLCKIAAKKGIECINSFFSKKVVKKILINFGKPKLICIYNVFANIDDLRQFTKNLNELCNEHTIVSIESFSLYGIIKNNLFDNIYHEHLSYFYVENLRYFFKKYNLNIIYAENNSIKGGSIKILLSRRYLKSKSVTKVIKEERKLGIGKPYAFEKLKKINHENMIKLSKFISNLKDSRIAGYGASCGSTVLIHYYNLNNKLKILFDDELRRNNLFSPSTNIPVKNPNQSILSKIDIIIIISWRYKKNILKNFKKKFPLFYKKIDIFQILPKIKKIN